MDRDTRDDLVVTVVYAAVILVAMIVFASIDRPGRLDALAARLRRPAHPDDTMEARMMVQVQREISMMEHGCDN
jgi:hypothetical protein